MTCDECSDLFGDAVDGTLSPELQAQMNAHVGECAACRDLLNDLMEIHAAAATLDRLTPSPSVWDAIAARVGPPREPSRSWTLPASASLWRGMAAAATLAIVLGAAAWYDLSPRWNTPPGAANGSAAEIARAAATELQLAEQHYENAVKSL